MEAERVKLEKRLQQLQRKGPERPAERRPYPSVYPKFRNPDPPHQTWSGRGEKPRWISELLANGKQLNDLRIEQPNEVPKTKPQAVAH